MLRSLAERRILFDVLTNANSDSDMHVPIRLACV